MYAGLRRQLCRDRAPAMRLTHRWWPCTQQAYATVRASLDAQTLRQFSFSTVCAESPEQLVARWTHARSLLAHNILGMYFFFFPSWSEAKGVTLKIA